MVFKLRLGTPDCIWTQRFDRSYRKDHDLKIKLSTSKDPAGHQG